MDCKDSCSKKASDSFIERLKELKDEKDESQEKLAKILADTTKGKLTKSAVGNWINPKIRNQPEYDMLVAIADHYDVSIDWLFGRTNATRRIDPDKQKVMAYLGISENDVDRLKELTSLYPKGFNLLLRCRSLRPLIYAIQRGINSAKDRIPYRLYNENKSKYLDDHAYFASDIIKHEYDTLFARLQSDVDEAIFLIGRRRLDNGNGNPTKE